MKPLNYTPRRYKSKQGHITKAVDEPRYYELSGVLDFLEMALDDFMDLTNEKYLRRGSDGLTYVYHLEVDKAAEAIGCETAADLYHQGTFF